MAEGRGLGAQIDMTAPSQLRWAAGVFREAGSRSPELDASVLLEWVMRAAPTRLASDPVITLSTEQATRYATWVERRARGEPVSFITGHKAFMGLDLHVTPDVLLVRPLTRLVAEIALELVRLRAPRQTLVADIGTGSGALALALAVLEPSIVRVYATDSSPEALAVAKENGRRYGLDGRVEWLLGDLLAPLPEPVDLLVANLPYVPEAGRQPTPSSRFEPAVAFYGGPDGLDLIRRLISQLPGALRSGGTVVLEVGPGQRDAVEAQLATHLPGVVIHGLLPGDTIVVAEIDG
jgi:release factor glutamine methyltransferase